MRFWVFVGRLPGLSGRLLGLAAVVSTEKACGKLELN